MNDTILLDAGMDTLIERFGAVDTQRFVYLIKKEPFDYTEFRHTLFEGMTIQDIRREAERAGREADARALADERNDESQTAQPAECR